MPASMNSSDAKLTRSSISSISRDLSCRIINGGVLAEVESLEKRSRDEPLRTDRRSRALFSAKLPRSDRQARPQPRLRVQDGRGQRSDRKSTRLNSSHGYISYAVFCLKKKKNKKK